MPTILAKAIARVASTVVLIRRGVSFTWHKDLGKPSRALDITNARHYVHQMYVCTASMRFEASI